MQLPDANVQKIVDSETLTADTFYLFDIFFVILQPKNPFYHDSKRNT